MVARLLAAAIGRQSGDGVGDPVGDEGTDLKGGGGGRGGSIQYMERSVAVYQGKVVEEGAPPIHSLGPDAGRCAAQVGKV